MTNPKNKNDADFRKGLPPELQDLDRELSAIRIEERPSFGPELQSELIRAGQHVEGRPTQLPRPWARTLLAASLAGLMIAGVSVPSARALMVDLVQSVIEAVTPTTAPEVPEVQLPELPVQAPVALPEEPSSSVELSEPILTPEEEITEAAEMFRPTTNITFPYLLYRQQAEAMIRSFYPLTFQRAGVGGVVKVVFWVDTEGVPQNVRLREGSGHRSLNYAAMRAVQELRFVPATRDEEPVGTWVELDIHFVPGGESGFLGLDPAPSGGVGG
jgi:TonB family protein